MKVLKNFNGVKKDEIIDVSEALSKILDFKGLATYNDCDLIKSNIVDVMNKKEKEVKEDIEQEEDSIVFSKPKKNKKQKNSKSE